jgi:hypothetical protein
LLYHSSLPRRPHQIHNQEGYASSTSSPTFSTTSSPILFGAKTIQPHHAPPFTVHEAVSNHQIFQEQQAAHDHQVLHDQQDFDDQQDFGHQPVFHDQPAFNDQAAFHDRPVFQAQPLFQAHLPPPTPEPLVHHRGTVLPPVIATTLSPVPTTTVADLLVRNQL